MIVRYDWIIGICSSDADGVKLLRFVGTKDEIKTKLMQLILEDKANDEENWDFGCESANDIRDEYNGLGYEFYGYGCYHDYHIDYTAKEYGKDFRKYQSEYISVDGKDVILCGTDMAYEEELWGDAYELVENFFNKWSGADSDVCTDLATEIREMVLEKFSEVKNIEFVDVYDEY